MRPKRRPTRPASNDGRGRPAPEPPRPPPRTAAGPGPAAGAAPERVDQAARSAEPGPGEAASSAIADTGAPSTDAPRVHELEQKVARLTSTLEGMHADRERVQGVADRFQGMEDRMKTLLQLSEILSVRYNPFLEREEGSLFDDRDPHHFLPRHEIVPVDEEPVPVTQARSPGPTPRAEAPSTDAPSAPIPSAHHPSAEAPALAVSASGSASAASAPLDAGLDAPPDAPLVAALDARLDARMDAWAEGALGDGSGLADALAQIEAVDRNVPNTTGPAEVHAPPPPTMPVAAPAMTPWQAHDVPTAPAPAPPASMAPSTASAVLPAASAAPSAGSARPPTHSAVSPAVTAASSFGPSAHPLPTLTEPPRKQAYWALCWFEELARQGDPSEIHLFLDHYARLGWVPREHQAWMALLADGVAPRRDDLSWSDLALLGPELARLHRHNLRFLDRLFRSGFADDGPEAWERQAARELGGA